MSFFNNFLDQFPHHYYLAYEWQLPVVSESAYLKLSGSLIHGYVDEFEDKLQFNQTGWTPAIVSSFGWKHKDVSGVGCTWRSRCDVSRR
jgi:hypothetical protein